MQLNYVKMHGAGNKILIVDQRRTGMSPPSAGTLRRLSREEPGPGFDQLMWLQPSDNAAAAAAYRVFNSDGSEVEQCGNGVRCVALLLTREIKAKRLLFESPVGLVEARVDEDGRIAVDMGNPEFEPENVPFIAEQQADRYDIDAGGVNVTASVLSMGNPHCVLLVDDVVSADVDTLGPLLENHDRFPARSNVGFMQLRDRNHVDLRVYERGTGETLACGTGACAAVVAGRILGHLDEKVCVNLPGGQLVVSWPGVAKPVWLAGDAELISEGTIDL